MDNETKPVRDAYLAAVDEIGDAWTFLITREAFFGATRFQEFCDTLNISRARLTERLKYLTEIGVFERRRYNESTRRFEYRFTDKGLAIYPVALTMISWGENWRSISRTPNLRHASCGAALTVKPACKKCLNPIDPKDLHWPKIQPLNAAMPAGGNVRGWRKMASFDAASKRSDPAIEALKAVGDRWSMLIVYGAMQTEFRFREAQSKLGLAHNILSDRLKHLLAEDILERTDSGKRAAYRITPAGQAMLDIILTMRTWALDWIPRKDHRWNKLTHQPCGTNLRVVCLCEHCGEQIVPQEVTY